MNNEPTVNIPLWQYIDMLRERAKYHPQAFIGEDDYQRITSCPNWKNYAHIERSQTPSPQPLYILKRRNEWEIENKQRQQAKAHAEERRKKYLEEKEEIEKLKNQLGEKLKLSSKFIDHVTNKLSKEQLKNLLNK